jgi:hypothetical protein
MGRFRRTSAQKWELRSDDGKQAVLDIGHWGSAIFKQAPEQRPAMVASLCFVRPAAVGGARSSRGGSRSTSWLALPSIVRSQRVGLRGDI